MHCVLSHLLRERWWHGVRHHWWWWWWLWGLRWWLLSIEREWRVVHSVLSGPLHSPKLRWALEVLITKGSHLVRGSTETTLSVAVVIAVAIVTTRTTTVSAVIPAVLVLATEGTLWPAAEPPIVVPVPVATTTTKVITPPSPRIPIPAVILVATSSPPSATSSVLCHLDQLWVDGLVGLAEHRDQVTGLFHVVGGEEGVGSARFFDCGPCVQYDGYNPQRS